MRRLFIALLAFSLFAAACGDDSDDATSTDDTESTDDTGADDAPTDDDAPADDAPADDDDAAADDDDDMLEAIRVPEDYPTIQEAVDAAVEGDLILISPGVYNESVAVETDNLVIRGLDRNTVILDGEHDPERGNGFIVFSDGVAIENLTARNYQSNGVFFTGDYDADRILRGYRASYITTYNNGLYGLYAFNAEYGLFEQSYGSGHPDSAVYIGQCQPCNAVVTDVIAENNTLGYSGTNAGGNLHIVNSEWTGNRVGMVPNTLDSEELAPQRGAVFAGNWIHDNGNPDTPMRSEIWELAWGIGLVLAGGNDNLVTRNLVENNDTGGIATSLFFDDNLWLASNNTVSDNVLRGNEIDLVLLTDFDGMAGPVVLEIEPGEPQVGADGNCFEGNTFTTSAPEDIETVAACGGGTEPLVGVPPLTVALASSPMTGVDYQTMPAPPEQPTMPDAETAPARPADVIPEVDNFDLDSITLPTGA